MKIKIAHLIFSLAIASNSYSAVYNVSNVTSGYGTDDALFANANDTLLNGGIVAFGTFGGTGFDMLDLPTSIANFTILRSALTGTAGNDIGTGFAGYVQTSFDDPSILEPNGLIGQTLFVFVGNAATLASSTAYGLFSAGLIKEDSPQENSYGANPKTAIDTNALLLGEIGTFTGDLGTALDTGLQTYSTLKLVAPVPEPSVVILGGLGALIACVRRRRI